MHTLRGGEGERVVNVRGAVVGRPQHKINDRRNIKQNQSLVLTTRFAAEFGKYNFDLDIDGKEGRNREDIRVTQFLLGSFVCASLGALGLSATRHLDVVKWSKQYPINKA